MALYLNRTALGLDSRTLLDSHMVQGRPPPTLDGMERKREGSMDSTDQQIQMKERRLLLFSTRIRFTPQTQPIRETAIDKILEQNLLLCDTPQSAREIESQCLDLNGHPFSLE